MTNGPEFEQVLDELVDELPAVSRAAAALTKCRTIRPHSMGMQPDDLAAVRELVKLIEAQRAVAPAKDYAKALLCLSLIHISEPTRPY